MLVIISEDLSEPLLSHVEVMVGIHEVDVLVDVQIEAMKMSGALGQSRLGVFRIFSTDEAELALADCLGRNGSFCNLTNYREMFRTFRRFDRPPKIKNRPPHDLQDHFVTTGHEEDLLPFFNTEPITNPFGNRHPPLPGHD